MLWRFEIRSIERCTDINSSLNLFYSLLQDLTGSRKCNNWRKCNNRQAFMVARLWCADGRWCAAERADYSQWSNWIYFLCFIPGDPMQMFTHTNKSYCVMRVDRCLPWKQLLYYHVFILKCKDNLRLVNPRLIDSSWFFHSSLLRLVCTDLAVQDLLELSKVIHDSLQLRQYPTVCSAPPSQHQRVSTRYQSPATTDSANDLSNTGVMMENQNLSWCVSLFSQMTFQYSMLWLLYKFL